MLWLESHSAKVVARYAVDLVVLGQSFVGHRVVGMQEIQHAAIVLQDLVKERDRFLLHRGFQGRVELTVCRLVDRQEVQQLHAQPLPGKVPGKTPGPSIGQHAFDLGGQNSRIGQTPGRCQVEEFFVRRAGPQEHREPSGQFPVCQAVGVLVLVLAGPNRPVWWDEIEELGRREHGGQDFEDGLLRIVALGSDCAEQGQFLFDLCSCGRASPGARQEPGQHVSCVGRFVGVVVAVDEYSSVREWWPVFVDGCCDLDVIDLDVAL